MITEARLAELLKRTLTAAYLSDTLDCATSTDDRHRSFTDLAWVADSMADFLAQELAAALDTTAVPQGDGAHR